MRQRFFALAVTLVFAALLFFVAPSVRAEDSDIVPRGSTLLDAFAKMQRAGLLGKTPIRLGNFVGEVLVTRGSLATLLVQNAVWEKTEAGDAVAGALRTATYALEPELKRRTGGKSAGELLGTLKNATKPTVALALDGKARASRGNSGSDNGLLLYRASAVGGIGRDGQYGALVSNFPQQYRRLYDSDRNRGGHEEVAEAYASVRGRNGLVVTLGRVPLRWGAGYRGAMFIGDNQPPFDQYSIEFPFSLGKAFGRDYRHTQFGTQFKDGDRRKYIGGRRIELRLSGKWSADFQYGYITDYGPRIIPAILITPVPFGINTDRTGPFRSLFGKRSRDLDTQFNYFNQFNINYRAGDRTRAYVQFLADDFSSVPEKGGARKIGYLVGGALGKNGTDVILEFSYTDPTTYTFKTNGLQWERNGYSIGQLAGANAEEIFARVQHAVLPDLLLHAQGRKRWRTSRDFFPTPEAETGEIGALYRLDNRQSVTFAFRYYNQERFPFATPAPNKDTPANPPNFGFDTTRRELEIGYQILF